MTEKMAVKSAKTVKKKRKRRSRAGIKRVVIAGRAPHRPPFVPNDDQRKYVQRQRLAGDTEERIAQSLPIQMDGEGGVLARGIDAKTLRKYFADDLDHSTKDLMGNLAATGYQKALNGDNQLLMFLLRTRGGDAFIERKELTGKDGTPLSGPPILLVEYVDGDPGETSAA